jgi:hypothetical protein
MASHFITSSAEKSNTVKFLVKEKVKQAEILHSLNMQYREDTLSYARVYYKYNKFSEGCKEVSILLHVHVHLTADGKK